MYSYAHVILRAQITVFISFQKDPGVKNTWEFLSSKQSFCLNPYSLVILKRCSLTQIQSCVHTTHTCARTHTHPHTHVHSSNLALEVPRRRQGEKAQVYNVFLFKIMALALITAKTLPCLILYLSVLLTVLYPLG